MAEPQQLQSALRNQGRLLGETCRRVDALTESVNSLAQQQAGQLAQLIQISDSLGDLTERLTLLTAPPTAGAESATPAPVPAPAVAGSFPVSKPEKYDGAPSQCQGFLLQCSLFFSNSPPSSDSARISFVVSRLTGRALDWATAVWRSYGQATYERFIQDFSEVFDHPNEGRSSGELLIRMRQGIRPVAEYALDFRIVAAGSGWNEPALVVTFRNGLHPDLLKELACRDDGLDLDKLIALAIRLDQLKLAPGSWHARGPWELCLVLPPESPVTACRRNRCRPTLHVSPQRNGAGDDKRVSACTVARSGIFFGTAARGREGTYRRLRPKAERTGPVPRW
ncbi:hypothetical protein NFI96_006277 [Prochilodus magdalenae]|nr:hypothetical protein NFI96_006277 [Prochilodus magdalenae]